MKIRSVGAELFHTDGRTDVTQLIVAFHSFAMAPENWNAVADVSRFRIYVLEFL
jgi:hypothetical protein